MLDSGRFSCSKPILGLLYVVIYGNRVLIVKVDLQISKHREATFLLIIPVICRVVLVEMYGHII